MSKRIVRTSKQLAAERQIHAAIAHFQNGEFECAISLCSAAEGQMPEPEEPTHFFAILKKASAENPPPDGPKEDFNYAANWMKHGWGVQETEIEEWEVTFWLNRAISKYRAVYGRGTPDMVALFPWAE
ncbi:hypothetical protein [Methylosinus sp. LW4]|uniref:hypothetical protein n=1 Tax=Methylosinus sp. LW4 TaxID=136993 RepID=UPI00036A898C|nr:hypothetical protein [Methylosinus sp. LW4]